MNIKELKTYVDKYNDDLTKRYGDYAEDYCFLEYRKGRYNLDDCLDKFTKVFFVDGEYFGPSEVEIDEHLGFITNQEDFYINNKFLDLCIREDIKGEDAYDLYYKQLEGAINTK